MHPGSMREVEGTLIREVMGWPIVDDPAAADRYPAAFWSSRSRSFMLVRRPGTEPRRFSPCRCLRDCFEVRRAIASERFDARLSRPVWDGNVRVVADCGSCEVVVEARSLPWTLSMALYQAASDGLT